MLSHATIPSQTYELSREEIFKILVALNENISPIRSVIRNAGEHVGAEFAHKVLSKESGLDCSLLYLQKALEELWESHCAPSRKEFLYDLYTLGALGRTLPGIDQRYPGLLANVAASVQGRQRDRVRRVQEHRALSSSSPSALYEDESLLICRCGHTHSIACVHCCRCNSRQHALCYYESEEIGDLTFPHICDDCTLQIPSGDEKPLDIDMNRLNLISSEPSQGSLGNTEDGNQSSVKPLALVKIGPFGFPGDGKFFWGPDPAEVRRHTEIMMARLLQIAHALVSSGLDKSGLEAVTMGKSSTAFGSILETAHGSTYRSKLLKLLTQKCQPEDELARLLTATLATKLVALVFAPPQQKRQTVEGLLLRTICKKIYQINGPEVLGDLCRVSLLALNQEETEDFEALIKSDGEEHAKYIMIAVMQMVCFNRSVSDKTREKYSKASHDALTWYKMFREICVSSMKLETRLGLAERFYEFYTPKINSKTRPKLMVDEGGNSVTEHGTVEICMMPAVIEYRPEQICQHSDMPVGLSPNGMYISATETQRLEGDILSPAIVAWKKLD